MEFYFTWNDGGGRHIYYLFKGTVGNHFNIILLKAWEGFTLNNIIIHKYQTINE